MLFAEIGLPDGAVYALPWDSDGSRYFTGTRRVVEREDRDRDGIVMIDGTQWSHGRIQWRPSLDDENLTVEQARKRAAALIAAAVSWTGSNDHRHRCGVYGEHSADPRNDGAGQAR